MKILAFVDTHGSKDALKRIASTAKKEKVDYLVCAGDVTIFSDSLKQILAKLDEIGKPILMLHGNHEDESELKAACEKTKNIKFMHKQVFETNGYVFMCYGGGGFSLKNKDFEQWSKQAMKTISEGKKIILVTHGPPYGTKLDLILDQSAGCKSIRQFIKQVQPKLAISGHLHENAGMKDKIDNTKIINPGPWGVVLSV
jgi:putative phosphoesterase